MNHGWIFIGDEAADYTIKEFASRHYQGQNNASRFPMLNVVFVAPTPRKAGHALQIVLPLLAFMVLLVGGGFYIVRKRKTSYSSLN